MKNLLFMVNTELNFLNEYYNGWINEINSYEIDNVFSSEKERIIKRCLLSHKRISEGIKLLNDDELFEIFKLSNKAMLISMINNDKLSIFIKACNY